MHAHQSIRSTNNQQNGHAWSLGITPPLPTVLYAGLLKRFLIKGHTKASADTHTPGNFYVKSKSRILCTPDKTLVKLFKIGCTWGVSEPQYYMTGLICSTAQIRYLPKRIRKERQRQTFHHHHRHHRRFQNVGLPKAQRKKQRSDNTHTPKHLTREKKGRETHESGLLAVARIRLRPMPRDKLQGKEEEAEEGGVWPIRILEHARSDQVVTTVIFHLCLGRASRDPDNEPEESRSTERGLCYPVLYLPVVNSIQTRAKAASCCASPAVVPCSLSLSLSAARLSP
ncbi:hypothetical protein V8C44DRAFT_336226 [Trichoderma aethiopicum]